MSTASEGSDIDEPVKGSEQPIAKIGVTNDESSSLDAAKRSRMSVDRPTEHELAFFPELWESRAVVENYLTIRNTTLITWISNQIKECTVQDVHAKLRPPANADIEFISSIVNYLTRYGIINYGRYARVNKLPKWLPRENRLVVVIGAGAAGIAAATQLISFGFDVIIVEGRNRIGGRCQNHYSHGQVMELGCDTIRNADISPITTLMHQVPVRQYQTFKYIPIYQDGNPVHPNKDQLMEKMYTNVRGALTYLAHNNEHIQEDGLFVSRQQAFENVFNMIERHSLMNYYNYCKATYEICTKREHHYKKMDCYRKTALMGEKMLTELPDHSDQLLRRSLKRDIAEAMRKFDEEFAAFELCENHFIQHKKSPCCKQYMHPKDFRTYNFLLGFEEFLYGAQLEKVQFTNNAHHNKEQGSVIRLQRGCADLLEQVAQKRGLDIRLNHTVREINYHAPDHVTLVIEKHGGEIAKIKPSFVVSTLPIGVLKKSIEEDERAPLFSPDLPEKKIEAIRGMGSALINKVVLMFDRCFWDFQGRYQFCVISPAVKTRAAMLVWSSVPDSKVLTTYIVGAADLHDLPDETLVSNAMACLRELFPTTCPADPLTAYCTRWHKDEYAFGSGSYMGLRTKRKHYEDLAEPVRTSDGKGRVYFAGEHTSFHHSNTIEGAWLSGIRVAADMANEHVGVGFVNNAHLPSTFLSTTVIPRTRRVDFDDDGRRLDLEE